MELFVNPANIVDEQDQEDKEVSKRFHKFLKNFKIDLIISNQILQFLQ